MPANTGIPTYQFSLASSAAGAGGHAFWEWGTRGAPANEVARMHRVLTAALIVSGFHAADGTVVQPAIGPMGKRTREVARGQGPYFLEDRSCSSDSSLASLVIAASGRRLVPTVGRIALASGRGGQVPALWAVSALHAAARAVILIKRHSLCRYQITTSLAGIQFDCIGRSHRAEADRLKCRRIPEARRRRDERRG